MDNLVDDTKNKECLICSFPLSQRKFIAVIPCSCSDIVVCAICAIRLRVFEKKRTCPFCKAPWKTFLVSLKNYGCSYSKIDFREKVFDVSIDVYFENESDLFFFKQLRSYHCIICKRKHNKTTDFNSMIALAEHLKFEHSRYFCEICAGNQKIFPFEFDLFTKSELKKHKKEGFNKSKNKTNMEPHPLCKFCNQMCFDLDALYNHLERRHVMCQFCRARGTHVYENDLEGIQEHFRTHHYLCEAPECLAQQFVVFDNGIDLNDHFIHYHGKDLTPEQRKKKSNITQYSNFGNSQPTRLSRYRQNTRESYHPTAARNLTTNLTTRGNQIEFPELPRSSISKSSSIRLVKNANDKVLQRQRTFALPKLPSATKNTTPQINANQSRNNQKTPSKSDRILDEIINSATKNSAGRNRFNGKKNRKKKKEPRENAPRKQSIFHRNMEFPKAFAYEELPQRHAELHKKIKAIVKSHRKFEKFSSLYFDFATKDLSAFEFCDHFVNIFGATDDILSCLLDVIRLLSDRKKAMKLFKVCVATDFDSLRQKLPKNPTGLIKEKNQIINIESKEERPKIIETKEENDSQAEPIETKEENDSQAESIEIERLYNRNLKSIRIPKKFSFFQVFAKFMAMEMIIRKNKNEMRIETENETVEEKLIKMENASRNYAEVQIEKIQNDTPNFLIYRRIKNLPFVTENTMKNLAGLVDIYSRKNSCSSWVKITVDKMTFEEIFVVFVYLETCLLLVEKEIE